jgi:hypothetical protein
MPAVTADTIALPRVPDPGPEAAERRVLSVTTAPSGLEGEGFPVRRAFAGVDLATLDPFVHMDQMGEVDYGPGEPKGTPWHPHRGFETVTYMIDGVFQHQDSNGGGLITDGDTRWMTAGAELSICSPLTCVDDHAGICRPGARRMPALELNVQDRRKWPRIGMRRHAHHDQAAQRVGGALGRSRSPKGQSSSRESSRLAVSGLSVAMLTENPLLRTVSRVVHA